MLISFIGSPCSGKTTTAAMLFSQLKEQGTTCEFITEQARSYIAEQRYLKQLHPSEQVHLTDADQVAIMEKQLYIDTVFRYSVRNGLVISDSSPLNALLYMTEELRCSERVKMLTFRAAQQTDLIFFAPAVAPASSYDPNRIHTIEQSKAIEASMFVVFNATCPEIFPKIVPLKGSTNARYSAAHRAVMDAILA